MKSPIRRTLVSVAALFLIAGLGLTGCKDEGPAGRGMKAPVPQPIKPFDPAAREKQIKPREILPYSRIGKRSPFKTLIKETVLTEKREEKGLSPLETYDVSGFKLIGIVRTDPQNMAMLVTPDGKGFTVMPGMHVGLHDGKITKITADTVEVVEMVTNYRGEMIPQTVRLELQKEEEQ